jgi:hypothetical protein
MNYSNVFRIIFVRGRTLLNSGDNLLKPMKVDDAFNRLFKQPWFNVSQRRLKDFVKWIRELEFHQMVYSDFKVAAE